MALHGDVMVNGRAIGGWRAVRGEQVAGTTDDPVYEYRVKAYINDDEVETTVQHRHSSGAIVLAVSSLITLLGDADEDVSAA